MTLRRLGLNNKGRGLVLSKRFVVGGEDREMRVDC